MDTAIRKQTHVTNKTSALLQTTGGNGELNIVLSRNHNTDLRT